MDLEEIAKSVKRFFTKAVGITAIPLTLLIGCPTPVGPNPPIPPAPNEIPEKPSMTAYSQAIEPNRLIQLLIYDNSDNEHGFNLERKTEDGDFVPIANLPADSESYDDWDITMSTEYTYRIKAYNYRYGSSDWFETTATGAGPQTGTITLYATEDSWVAESSPDNNNNFAWGDRLIVSDNPFGEEYSYIKFPYEDIPSYATVDSAQLRLVTWNEEMLGTLDSVTVGNVGVGTFPSFNWYENTVTWNNRPDLQGYFIMYKYLPSQKDQPVYWDITTLLDDWAGMGIYNHGLVIAPGLPGATVRGFYSKDQPDASKSPSLIVDYTW